MQEYARIQVSTNAHSLVQGQSQILSLYRRIRASENLHSHNLCSDYELSQQC